MRDFLHNIWHKFQEAITLGRVWHEYFVLKYWYAGVSQWCDLALYNMYKLDSSNEGTDAR